MTDTEELLMRRHEAMQMAARAALHTQGISNPVSLIFDQPKLSAFIFALVAAIPLGLWYFGAPGPIPAFSEGQTVQMALDGRPVMVIAAGCTNECEYRVRVASTDGYQELWVSEYELTPQ